MGRLKQQPPRLGRLPPRISTHRDVEGHSAVLESWRAWYKTPAWQAIRIQVFVRDAYTCQMKGCGKVTSRPIADHVRPHRGDRARFFNPGNVQTLCKPCHDGAKQRAERRGG
jgi:5-methylcytosine-specific restriction protein A